MKLLNQNNVVLCKEMVYQLQNVVYESFIKSKESVELKQTFVMLTMMLIAPFHLF